MARKRSALQQRPDYDRRMPAIVTAVEVASNRRGQPVGDRDRERAARPGAMALCRSAVPPRPRSRQ
ncbi:hypothetical protein SPHINGO8AM_150073 [Sphingomonas sp. 8AM]|nr:hypothetical protein SPHINGO8AM_150073 [Sphingomonas sp. 8AM]